MNENLSNQVKTICSLFNLYSLCSLEKRRGSNFQPLQYMQPCRKVCDICQIMSKWIWTSQNVSKLVKVRLGRICILYNLCNFAEKWVRFGKMSQNDLTNQNESKLLKARWVEIAGSLDILCSHSENWVKFVKMSQKKSKWIKSS